ncbi:GPI-anchored membrane protein [Penicillium rolfsii]|nr:GPI-anchored membrane protein [Penicillium rolfsii]
MRVTILSFLVAFTATTTAILVTYPPKGEKIDWSKPVTIKWDSVETDPDTFDLYLVNQAVNPSVSTLVASNVDTSKGSYTIKANNQDLTPSDTGGGYQIDFKSSNGGGILAQSQQFKVVDYDQYYCIDVCFHDSFFDRFFLFSDHYSLLHQCVYPHHLFFINYYTYSYFYLCFIFYDELFFQCVYPKLFFLCYLCYRFKIPFGSFNPRYFFLEFYLEYIHNIKIYPFQHYTFYTCKDSFLSVFSHYIKIFFCIVYFPFHNDYSNQDTYLHFLNQYQYSWSVYGAMSWLSFTLNASYNK